MREKPHPRIAAFPIGEGGPRSGARVLSYNGALETISLALSYRHCPIRLASLATFPSRGRLCPSLFFFSTYPVFALTIREYHLLKKGGEAATRAMNLEP